MLPEISREELAGALDIVARRALRSVRCDKTPIDAVALAQRLGLTVAWDDRQQGRARLVNLAMTNGRNAASIFVKHDPRPERLHWAVAHEIGEALAEKVFAQLAVDPHLVPQQARETIANGMAARLLLPHKSFHRAGNECQWDLLRLKEIYTTASHELIARRMLDFPPPVILSVYDQNQLAWRKSNAGYRLAPPCARELQARRQAHETCQAVYDDGPPAIRAWPIHEPDWKREIVRVEVDEFAEF
ncbi:MAG TPA: ImmA/IrrE family metallo-endopeptidase [Pirellulales bacterium]|jgi:Zn-dependent peptidase ImmA (M78 family)|nr:ImmA/IrrE family metallo-endopeptidase [Pirellulales bacterium]